MSIEFKTDAVRLFAEIGFLGLSRGNPAASDAIFTMLRHVRPQSEVPAIGGALTALAANRPDAAIERLKQGAQTPAVLAISVLAYAQLGQKQDAADLLDELENSDAEPELLEMARGALASDGV